MGKNIVILLSIFFSNACFAKNIDTEPIALSKFNASIVNVRNYFEECRARESVILNRNIFNGIKASEIDKKIALKYYYFKAAAECSSGAVKDYLLASAVRIFGDKSAPRSLRDADELIVSNHLLLLQAEAEYSLLSGENKKAFAAIKELHSPFDLIRSAKELGLY